MKAIIILSILASVPFTVANAFDRPYTSSNLTGVWESNNRNVTIEIRDYGDAMRVKRQQLFRKWKDFRQIEFNVFSDYEGNIIEILNGNTLIWIQRGQRNTVQFYKVGRFRGLNNGVRYYDQGYNQRRYDSRRNDSRRYDSRNRNSRRSDNRRSNRRRNPYCG